MTVDKFSYHLSECEASLYIAIPTRCLRKSSCMDFQGVLAGFSEDLHTALHAEP